MSKQDLTDIQIVIDKLFGRLDGSSTGGELTQYNHALRVQITKKKKLGGTLTAREQDLVAAVGQIADQKSGGSLWVFVLVLLVIGGLYVAYRFLSGQAKP